MLIKCLSSFSFFFFCCNNLIHFAYVILPVVLFFRRKHLTAEREKAEMPSFGPTILPEPDTSPPSTPIGKNVQAIFSSMYAWAYYSSYFLMLIHARDLLCLYNCYWQSNPLSFSFALALFLSYRSIFHSVFSFVFR